MTDDKPRHYSPIQNIIDYFVDKHRFSMRILEVGPGEIPFPIATHYIDHLDRPKIKGEKIILNICEDTLPFEDKYFDFVYCRHVLEDLHNPEFIFKELKRVCKNGYIETPSPIAEMSNVEVGAGYRGYVHHRYFVWNNNDGVINFLAKYPFVECLITQNYDKILEDPFYWNSYFMWNEGEEEPRYKMYYHDVDYVIHTSYNKVISKALNECFNNVAVFKNIIMKR